MIRSIIGCLFQARKFFSVDDPHDRDGHVLHHENVGDYRANAGQYLRPQSYVLQHGYVHPRGYAYG